MAEKKAAMLNILDRITGRQTPARRALWERRKNPENPSIMDGTGKLAQDKPSGAERSVQAVLDVLGLIPGPGAAAKIGVGVAGLGVTAGMMAAGSKGAAKVGTVSKEAGAITPTGLRELLTIHNTRPHQLAKVLSDAKDKRQKPVLDALSYGITKRKPLYEFGSVTLIPNPKVIDPAVNPNSILHNRDVYTARSADIRAGNTTYEALRRTGVKKTEDATPEDAHGVAIDFSPEFSSFKQYEKSIAGSGTLGKDYLVESQKLMTAMEEYAYEYSKNNPESIRKLSRHMLYRDKGGGVLTVSPESYKALFTELAKKGDKKAIELIGRAKTLGSQYAEGKLLEPLEVNSDNIVAAVFAPVSSANKNQEHALIKTLQDMGIPAGYPASLLSPETVSKFYRLADIKANKAVAAMQDVDPAAWPPTGAKRTAESLLSNVTGATDVKAYSELWPLLASRGQFSEADTFSIIQDVFTNNIFASDNAVEATLQQFLPHSFFAK